MKLRELLSERISLSSITPNVNKELLDAVVKIIKKPLSSSPASKTDPSKMDMQFLLKYNTLFVNALTPILSKFASDVAKTKITVQFKKLGNGTGHFDEDTNTITITTKILVNLINIVFNQYSKTINPDEIDAIVHNLTTIFLHEVTHATQIARGHKYEFKRGYIEKNKLKFFTDLVRDEFNSEEEKKRSREVYYSQPDEIAAYAQEASTNLINKIYNLPAEDQLAAIGEFLKEITRNATSYNDFKNNPAPGYIKTYRRYLKLIYQYLDDYKDTLG